jgi:hypothetical protein
VLQTLQTTSPDLIYEIISSTTSKFGPNAYVEITDYIDKKIE